ncbi:MAG: hypothetical protein KZQ83_04420 [gamma proteobacterium symbiont of Taylorina sp.]|nr:hypothetical protein [gamma proteobacterium symbiont of Taylorina sp.]
MSVILLSGQSVTLHIHGLEQDHKHEIEQTSIHTSVQAAIDHSHLSKIHFANDSSHDFDHDDLVYDELFSGFDVNDNAFFNKISNNTLLVALLSIVINFFVAVFCLKIVYRYRDEEFIYPFRYVFAPPLRAPPL